MEEKFLNFVNKNKLFKKGERVIVACSGGADSVALLVLLNKYSEMFGISIVAVHVNHGIRGDEAKRDEDYVKFIADKLGIECVVKYVDAPLYAKENKKTLEQSARELRYQALRQAKEELNAIKIAVAHNRGDQTESVLMHLFRGAGLSGVVGMHPIANDIVRPLLELEKAELIDYLNELKIDFKEDSTNNDINYTRNFIRHKIIGELEKVYPAVSENIYKFSLKMREIEEYVSSSLPKEFIKKSGSGVVLLNNARNEHPVILSRLIFSALDEINARTDVEEKHIEQIYKHFNAQVGKSLALPNNVSAIKTHEGVLFEKSEEFSQIQLPFQNNDELNSMLGRIVVKRENQCDLSAGALYVDLDRIPDNAVWRGVQNGDKFTKFSGGTKTLAKFLVDKKIDVSKRKKMLILASGDEVLVVPGVEISNKLKITEKTRQIASIRVI